MAHRDHQTKVRRWRGTIDVPITQEGLVEAEALGIKLEKAGGLDLVWHDGLSRCRRTANLLRAQEIKKHFGPRPWNMGPSFEGHEITKDSLIHARNLILSDSVPVGGESFSDWYGDWMTFLAVQEHVGEGKKVGIVTHNRNIQAVYATRQGEFRYDLYDCDGPSFMSVHVMNPQGEIEPWDGGDIVPGVYLIRHGETDWGT